MKLIYKMDKYLTEDNDNIIYNNKSDNGIYNDKKEIIKKENKFEISKNV